MGRGGKVDSHLPRFPHCPGKGAGKAVLRRPLGGVQLRSVSGVG